jgi:transposase
MKKTTIISKKDLSVALHGHSERDRRLHRLHSVALVLHGLSAVEVAGMFGDSPRAVSYWVTRFRKRGLDGLGERKSPGRPSTLTAAQRNKLQRFVARLDAGAKPVTGVVLASFVKKEFAHSLTVRQCWRILKRLRT